MPQDANGRKPSRQTLPRKKSLRRAGSGDTADDQEQTAGSRRQEGRENVRHGCSEAYQRFQNMAGMAREIVFSWLKICPFGLLTAFIRCFRLM